MLTLYAMHSSNAIGHDITFHHIMVFIRTVCWRQLWRLNFVKPSNVIILLVKKYQLHIIRPYVFQKVLKKK